MCVNNSKCEQQPLIPWYSVVDGDLFFFPTNQLPNDFWQSQSYDEVPPNQVSDGIKNPLIYEDTLTLL